MNTMTERFELRLDSEMINRIDQWRAEQPDVPSRAEAFRRLVEVGLDQHRAHTEFRPGKSERLIIWMLSELLNHQRGYQDKGKIKLIQEAIFGGHFWALDWEMTGVMHDMADERSEVSFVVDVLDMWNFIEEASDKLVESDRDRLESAIGRWERNPQFSGFDGNNETSYMGIARFLVDEMGRFTRFKGRGFNSHSRTISRYAAMLRVFEPIRKELVGRSLTVDEMITILKAR